LGENAENAQKNVENAHFAQKAKKCGKRAKKIAEMRKCGALFLPPPGNFFFLPTAVPIHFGQFLYLASNNSNGFRPNKHNRKVRCKTVVPFYSWMQKKGA
jgi:hypothetical protein